MGFLPALDSDGFIVVPPKEESVEFKRPRKINVKFEQEANAHMGSI